MATVSTQHGSTLSAWQAITIPEFPACNASAQFDVAIVGGGMTGLTVAYLLKNSGRSVCVLERGKIGQADTCHTSAHLTYVTDHRYSDLSRLFGKDEAYLTWKGAESAIGLIETIVREEQIDCDFDRVPGYMHTALSGNDGDEPVDLFTEAKTIRDAGFDATYMESVPVMDRSGIRFDNQAKFHPLKYLRGLAEKIQGDGCSIFEHSEVTDIESEPTRVHANGHTVHCDNLVIATHVPLMGKARFIKSTLLQTNLAAYTSYVIGAKIEKYGLPCALFWDTASPYHFLRIDCHEHEDYLIFGGNDHRTGQADHTEDAYAKLESLLLRFFPAARVESRWSGQVIDSHDGLPYLGESAKHQYIATGFGGNGITFGTLGGMIICDSICGRDNPWQDLFTVERKKFHASAWSYIRANLDYPFYMFKDWMGGDRQSQPMDLKLGEGKVIVRDGKRIACFRDEQGKLSEVSAVCTHLGCIVHWNSADQTWDCPCHGSRYSAVGAVLAGPAETPLQPVVVEQT